MVALIDVCASNHFFGTSDARKQVPLRQQPAKSNRVDNCHHDRRAVRKTTLLTPIASIRRIKKAKSPPRPSSAHAKTAEINAVPATRLQFPKPQSVRLRVTALQNVRWNSNCNPKGCPATTERAVHRNAHLRRLGERIHYKPKNSPAAKTKRRVRPRTRSRKPEGPCSPNEPPRRSTRLRPPISSSLFQKEARERGLRLSSSPHDNRILDVADRNRQNGISATSQQDTNLDRAPCSAKWLPLRPFFSLVSSALEHVARKNETEEHARRPNRHLRRRRRIGLSDSRRRSRGPPPAAASRPCQS